MGTTKGYSHSSFLQLDPKLSAKWTNGMEDGHSKTWEEVVRYYGVDPDQGLSPEQVKKHQDKYGPNGKTQILFLLIISSSLFFYEVMLELVDERDVTCAH